MKLMRKLLKKQGFAPDLLVTNKLRSYGAAHSHQPVRAAARGCERQGADLSSFSGFFGVARPAFRAPLILHVLEGHVDKVSDESVVYRFSTSR
jgi:hypothetical protein